MLTLAKLKDMIPNTIFKRGVIEDNPEGISPNSFSWVAVRGGIHDWAIYSTRGDVHYDWIKRHGDKVYDKSLIKQLVPCDDEAFKMYRY